MVRIDWIIERTHEHLVISSIYNQHISGIRCSCNGTTGDGKQGIALHSIVFDKINVESIRPTQKCRQVIPKIWKDEIAKFNENNDAANTAGMNRCLNPKCKPSQQSSGNNHIAFD